MPTIYANVAAPPACGDIVSTLKTAQHGSLHKLLKVSNGVAPSSVVPAMILQTKGFVDHVVVLFHSDKNKVGSFRFASTPDMDLLRDNYTYIGPFQPDEFVTLGY